MKLGLLPRLFAIVLALCSSIPLFGEQTSGVIRYKGKAVDATQLIVKFKKSPGIVARSRQGGLGEVLSEAGMEIDQRRFRGMPEVRVLRLSENTGAQTSARTVPSPKSAVPG